MIYRHFILSMLYAFILFGCDDQQSKYDRLITENDSLKKEIDELKNGERRLIAVVEKAYSEKDYLTAKKGIELLAIKHPESKKNIEFKIYSMEIEKIDLETKQKSDSEEKERIRLQNINNTGIWDVSYYVDEFGSPTKESYIRNSDYIEGVFSNTATQDSKLNVTFLINSASDFNLKLFEYARNNPVKGYSSQTYTVRVKDKDGKRYTFNATNYTDRLGFGSGDSRQLHRIFMKGGLIQFAITEDHTPTTEYKFDIHNADLYDNAYKKLISK